MESKKIITCNNLIWGIWVLILIILTGIYTIQSFSWCIGEGIHIPLFYALGQIIQGFIMPYIIITIFYVLACLRKNYGSMLWMFGIDLLSLGGIIYSIATFYEGPRLAKASILLILVNILTKGCLAFRKH